MAGILRAPSSESISRFGDIPHNSEDTIPYAARRQIMPEDLHGGVYVYFKGASDLEGKKMRYRAILSGSPSDFWIDKAEVLEGDETEPTFLDLNLIAMIDSWPVIGVEKGSYTIVPVWRPVPPPQKDPLP